MGIAEFTGCPGHSAGMLHNGPHADFNEGLHLRRRAARITGHDDVRRNGIMSAIRMKFCHGHDGRFQGIGISWDNGLEAQDDLGRRNEGIDAHMGAWGMTAAAMDLDGKVILACHDPAGTGMDLAFG